MKRQYTLAYQFITQWPTLIFWRITYLKKSTQEDISEVFATLKLWRGSISSLSFNQAYLKLRTALWTNKNLKWRDPIKDLLTRIIILGFRCNWLILYKRLEKSKREKIWQHWSWVIQELNDFKYSQGIFTNTTTLWRDIISLQLVNPHVIDHQQDSFRWQSKTSVRTGCIYKPRLHGTSKP